MSLTREEVIRYLESLTAEELGSLASEVLYRFGLPSPRAMPEPTSTTMGEPLRDDAYDVVVLGHGVGKLEVINIVRRVLSPAVGLMEAKRLVESPRFVLREQIPRREADALAEELRRAGAEVEVR